MKHLYEGLINIHKNNKVKYKLLKYLKPGDTFYWTDDFNLKSYILYKDESFLKNCQYTIKKIEDPEDISEGTAFTNNNEDTLISYEDNMHIYTKEHYRKTRIYGDCEWIYYPNERIIFATTKEQLIYIYNTYLK